MEISHMHAVKVDENHRIRLKVLSPGDYYEPHFHNADRIELRRMTAPEPRRRLSETECLDAMKRSALKFRASYDDLKKETREP